MTNQDLETLENFELWLRSQQPTTVVGKSATTCGCPLANWGKSVLGGQTFVDGGELWAESSQGTVSFYLSEMCALFVQKVDGFIASDITASEAIEILQECRWEIAATTLGVE
ncbi:hypothetical protein IQ266_11125 [filamentous cyanobacterium LEGE 11480]|uniref:Uncharacterized protein n=1 Tax=Romeriopsis navalis LEGE 11480 TaxID=2777977 RepID=A0A928VKJ1_9CYAN|nr:hypothetical protein [Romeriopsis navalis]MBE9030283.1 hypothetical protein [Romeriopsis navalis LEGE 11480]